MKSRFLRLAVALAMITAGCGGAGRGERGAGGDGAYNVILFSLDTLRADYAEQMPRLQQMASGGRSFTAVWSSSNWTMPSHVSLFTSQPFLEHQAPPPGSQPPFAEYGLSESRPTLTGALSAAGYHAAASTEGGYVGAAYGFGRDFDDYREVGKRAGVEARIDDHVANVRDAVAAAGDRPLFLFVHTYLAHDYFTNGRAYRRGLQRFGPELIDHGTFITAIRRGRLGPNHPLPTEYLRALYARGTELADRLLGSVVDEVLEATGGAPLLVVVTSDHGESLGDLSLDGNISWWHHGSGLPPSQIHVPLVLWTSTGAGAGETFSAPVSTIDVAPSLLARLGVAVPESFRGRADLFGVQPPADERPVTTPVMSGNNVVHPTYWRSRVEHALFAGDLKYTRADGVTGETRAESCVRRAQAAPLAECAALRRALADQIAASTGQALVVRADGPVTIELDPDAPTGVFAVQSSLPTTGPLLDVAAHRIVWQPTGPEDALVLIPRTRFLLLDRLLRGDMLVAESLVPIVEPPTAQVTADAPGLSLTARFDLESSPRAAEVPPAVLEQLRALGYLR